MERKLEIESKKLAIINPDSVYRPVQLSLDDMIALREGHTVYSDQVQNIN